jgi:HEAT repeat protein
MHYSFLIMVAAALANGPAAASADEQALRSAGLSTDGPALLDFFRARSQTAADPEELRKLVEQLSAGPEARARASAALVTKGILAVPALRHAVNDLVDAAAAEQARLCLQWIEGPSAGNLPSAAARLLLERKQAGAAEALLGFLPFADSPEVAEQAARALAALALADDRPEPALVKALEDKVPLRRAIAAEALCRADKPEQWPAIRKLLGDTSPAVRLRAALVLVKQEDAEAIPVLIELLAELPATQRLRAEEALRQLAGDWAPAVPQMKEDAISRRICRDAWAAWWRNTDGPALLDEFRKHTPDAAAQKRIRLLIGELGAERFIVRERAVSDLLALGPVAIPFLQEAMKGKDLERARRAEACLERIRKDDKHVLPAVATRLVALRRPAGAVEALLAYLPWSSGDGMTEGVQEALSTLAIKDGQPHPSLVKALADPLPLRRRIAGEALARRVSELRPALRKMIGDNDPSVRVGIGTALIAAGDREAVPLLIDALADLPQDEGSQALDLLYRLGGDTSPTAAAGTDAPGRQKCREAWAAWWKTKGPTVDLARLAGDGTSVLLGYTVLSEVDNGGNGRVREITRDGKTRWQIDGLQYPVDAFVIGGNRVLISEYNGRRVTERDFKGNIVWKAENLPNLVLNAQRLPSGNTFVATQFAIQEFDRSGKEVFNKQFAGNFLTAACKARDGKITVLTQQGQCILLDAKGTEIRNFPSGRTGGWTSGIDAMPGGKVLIAQPNVNQVVELDQMGKTVWKAPAPGVTTATHLPNGHVLTASHPNMQTQELDRNGRVVWEFRSDRHIFRARRR